MVVVRLVLAVGVALGVGCTQDSISELEPLPELNRDHFRCDAEPVLVARCAFVACHGNDVRPFKLYAEQRLRLGIEWDDYETPLTAEESEANFRSALGWVARNPGDADLLAEKPLDTIGGGLFHGAKDQFGNVDVFETRADPGYAILRAFVDGEGQNPNCAPREDVGP